MTTSSGSESATIFLEDLDEIDPRVQIELEQLNTATDTINKLEVELDEARSGFRQLLTESSQRIDTLAKKLGSCIDKSRPYYDARIKAREAQLETQRAALRFERANSAHAAAKEMVFLAEEGLQKQGRTFDPAWQEMLNHATIRVNEAETERNLSEIEHRKKSKSYNDVEQLVTQLQKDLKKAIVKSSLSTRRSLLQLNNLATQHQLLLLPYFEMNAQFHLLMEEQKKRVQSLEECVLKAKQSYSDALYSLEEISDEIHHKRKMREVHRALGIRGVGVGAESPPQPETLEYSKEQQKVAEDDRSETDECDYTPIPSNLKLPKSFSFSTLYCTLPRPTANSSSKPGVSLRKSFSVDTRQHDANNFKRFSIDSIPRPRPRALSIDNYSQTDIRELRMMSPISPKEHAHFMPQKSRNRSIVSRKSCENSLDDCDVSDTESLESIDVLGDDQIANLMLDGEAESMQTLIFTGNVVCKGTQTSENYGF